MSLNAALSLVLDEYSRGREQQYTKNAVAEFMRQEVPDAVSTIVGNNERYIVQGSAGQGTWAQIPWVAIFDQFITDTAQEGYYIVYLFKADLSGVYLSLNQGVTAVRNAYGTDRKKALKARAGDLLARLGKLDDAVTTGPIILGAPDIRVNSLGSDYEVGSICSILYEKSHIPDDTKLETDLNYFVALYDKLANSELSISFHIRENDEDDLDDVQLLQLRVHKRIERNAKLAKKAKEIHGYQCQICGFDFLSHYGDIGHEFIEAHHLTPLSKLSGENVTLSARDDFAVLCANCHRMIHRSGFISDLASFRARHWRV